MFVGSELLDWAIRTDRVGCERIGSVGRERLQVGRAAGHGDGVPIKLGHGDSSVKTISTGAICRCV